MTTQTKVDISFILPSLPSSFESGFKNRTNFVVTVNTEKDNAGKAPQNISTHTSADLNTRGYRAAVKMMVMTLNHY